MDWDNLCFNTATFIAGIFVLDYGADKFVDHTVVVGQRVGISPTLIALLTAGAEYEEVLLTVYRFQMHTDKHVSSLLWLQQSCNTVRPLPWAM